MVMRMDEMFKDIVGIHEVQVVLASHQPLLLEEFKKLNQTLRQEKPNLPPPAPSHAGGPPEPPSVPGRGGVAPGGAGRAGAGRESNAGLCSPNP